jgi:CcmD family protein
MGDMIYLAAGYVVFWLVTFIFIYTIISRQRHLEKEVRVLEQLVQEEEK